MSELTEQQKPERVSDSDLAIARKSKGIAVLLSFLISPLTYLYLKRPLMAVLNFVTFNFFFLGIVIVPLHSLLIINDARKRARLPARRSPGKEDRAPEKADDRAFEQKDRGHIDQCPNCGEGELNDARFCPQCGKELRHIILP